MKDVRQLRLVIRDILEETRRSKKGRKQRIMRKNTTEVNKARYNPALDKHRQMLAQDLYRNMTGHQKGFKTKKISQLREGEEIVWKKTFKNGMILSVFTSVRVEPDPSQKSGKTFRFAPKSQGRLIFRLEYTIPDRYAKVAGVPPDEQKYFSFSSQSVYRKGTFPQIIARINGSIEGLEAFGDRIQKAAAYFSKIAKGEKDFTIEKVQADMSADSGLTMTLDKKKGL